MTVPEDRTDHNHRIRHKRNLRSTLVEPFKQLKLGIWVMAISLIFIAIFAYLVASGLAEQYEQVMAIFKVVDANNQWELVQNDIVRAIVIKLAIAMVLYITILFGVIFMLTHRFYGPLVSIERFVNNIIEGNYQTRISVRKSDELGDLVVRLNQMAELLEKRHFTGKGDRRGQEAKLRGRRNVDLDSNNQDDSGQKDEVS